MKIIAAVALALGVSQFAHAAGFEKAVLWSGKEGGYANSGQSYVTTSEALFFNPAGLAGGQGGDLTIDLSPTNLKFRAPVVSSTAIEETDQNGSLVGAFFTKYKVNDRLGVGAGVYLGGGNKAVYENVALSADDSRVTYAPTIRTDLKLIEYSVGAAYEIIPGLRFGGAWRVGQVTASFSTVKKTVNNAAYSYFDVNKAKQTKYDGFRLGAQYEAPEKRWGVGLTYRNSLDFTAEGLGSATTTIISTNTTTPGSVGTARLSSSLPWAVSLGGNMLFGETFRLLASADLVKYSRNKEIGVQASINGTAVPNVPLNWKDMYLYRVGGEYTGFEMLRLKAGYALATAVTPKGDARPTVTPPGTGHVFTVGTGASFAKSFDFDAALEYAFTKGTGQMSPTPTGSTTKEMIVSTDNEYKVRVWAIHTGLAYRF